MYPNGPSKVPMDLIEGYDVSYLADRLRRTFHVNEL